jgi:hypothetical protein
MRSSARRGRPLSGDRRQRNRRALTLSGTGRSRPAVPPMARPMIRCHESSRARIDQRLFCRHRVRPTVAPPDSNAIVAPAGSGVMACVARESSRVGARDERFAEDADRVDRIRGDRFGDGANRPRASQLTRATPAVRANQSRGRPSPDARSGPEGSADGQRSNSAADAAGLERLGLCIAGLKQPSARRRETTVAVALQQRGPSGRENKAIAPRPVRTRFDAARSSHPPSRHLTVASMNRRPSRALTHGPAAQGLSKHITLLGQRQLVAHHGWRLFAAVNSLAVEVPVGGQSMRQSDAEIETIAVRSWHSSRSRRPSRSDRPWQSRSALTTEDGSAEWCL